jgi:predicted DNA-binding transcriptional regulator AlpA
MSDRGDLLLTSAEVARLAGISRQAIDAHADAGDLPSTTVLVPARRFREADVLAWLVRRPRRRRVK